MSSLSKCIDRAGKLISPVEAKVLLRSAEKYRGEGFDAVEANVGAVQDVIDDLKADLRSIVEQTIPTLGAPAEGAEFRQKFGTKADQASKLIGILTREYPEIRSRAQLAEFIADNAPKAKPFSESLFGILSYAVDVDEAGSAADWKGLYEQIDNPAKPIDQKQAIRDLITSDDNRQKKSVQIRQMATERGISVKEMQEQIEAELVAVINELASDPAISPQDLFRRSREIYDKQPLFSARTSTSVENQAYSTPAPLAVALKHMTGTTASTRMYEPTGGNGMLMVGAKLGESHANELNDLRAAALRNLGVGDVTQNDATTYTPNQKFPAVHANPPFGPIDNVNFNGFGIRKLEHIISLRALEAMEDNGTAALILGANMQQGETAKGAQWVFENYVYGHYNVVDNFEVDGELYANQGAKWPVRVIVVAGRKANPSVGDFAPKQVDRLTSWDDVWARAEKVHNETESQRKSMGAGGSPGVSGNPAPRPISTENGGGDAVQDGGSSGATGQGGKRGGNRGRQPTPAGQPTGVGTTVAPSGTVGESGGDGAQADVQPGGTGEQTAQLEGGDRGDAWTAGDAGGGTDGGVGGTEPRKLPESVSVNDRQVTYVPRSAGEPFGTLTPKSIGANIHAALDALVAKVGKLDEYVADRIHLPVEQLRSVLAADQIDGVALAIDQIENGGALIIGDETGIGKGRQAAALIRYAKAQGKIPVFFTKDPKLFTDMNGDLKDIQTQVKPLVLGDPEKASIVNASGDVIVKAPGSAKQKTLIEKIRKDGMKESGFDSIFATYSQINERNNRQLFLEELAHNNDIILILDEAHESAGDGETSMQAAFMFGGTIKRGSGSNIQKITVPGLLNAPGTKRGRGGVLYLSATYAKRPDNMPLYFRTDLSKASRNFGDLVKAMKSGGVALQQAVSEALAGVGQYLRRERDFTGVNYSLKRVQVADKAGLISQVDQVTSALSAIVDFSDAVRTAVLASNVGGTSTAMTQNQIDVTEFAAVVHNQVGQLLLAAKADEVVAEAVAAHGRGEKPVIALMNTMESFLDNYVKDYGIKPGKPITLSWRELLKHALSRTLRVTEKLPNGDKVISMADPVSLGVGDFYDRVVEEIDGIAIGFPVSPIDHIIQRLADSGINVGELTGRKSGIQYDKGSSEAGTYKQFKKANKNALVNGFNGGALDGLLLNASGATGLSIHAAPKFKDSRKRHMIIAQAALDINIFVQTLGRIKRTGMIEGGAEYTHLTLPLQAELRPAAVANRKMKSLNANTTAEAEGGVNIQAADFINKYGDKIVAEYLDGDPELQIALGLDVDHDADGVPKAKVDLAKKFTGRLALLPDATQQEIYSAIIPAYNEHIEQLRATGEYDLDIVIHDDWDGVQTSDLELERGTDESSIFTASVKAQRWEITDNRPVPTGEQMTREFNENTGGAQKFADDWAKFTETVDQRMADRVRNAEARVEEVMLMPPDKRGFSLTIAQTDLNQARIAATKWADTQSTFDRIFDQIGQPVALTDDKAHETWDGMLVGVKFPDLTKGTKVAPSRFQFRYLVYAPGGRMFVSGAKFFKREYLQSRSNKTLEDFVPTRGGGRYQRFIVTGNPIAAYKATGGSGKMVRFKTRAGDVVTGLLMRNNWNTSDLAIDPRFNFATSAAAVRFLTSQGNWGRTYPVEADGGMVRLGRGRLGDYEISVPSSSTGRKYYLDSPLRRLFGDFTKTANRMVVRVRESDLQKAVNRIVAISGNPTRAGGNTPEVMRMVADANNGRGSTLGAPPVAGSEDLLGAPPIRFKRSTDALTQLAQDHAHFKNWYSEFKTFLDEYLGKHKSYAPLVAEVLSATSAATSVEANVPRAVSALREFIDTGAFLSVKFEAHRQNLERAGRGEQLSGPKISQYSDAIFGNENAISVDRHIAQIMFGREKPTDLQIDAAKRRITQIANRLGWTPRQAQAALWAANQTLNNQVAQSYEAHLAKHRDAIIGLLTADRAGEGRGREAARRIARRISQGRRAAGSGSGVGGDAGRAQTDGVGLLGAPPSLPPHEQRLVDDGFIGTKEDKRTLLQKFSDYLADLRDYVRDELRQKTMDGLYAILRLERQVHGRNAEIDASASPYKAARNSAGIADQMRTLMEHSQLELRAGSFVQKAGTKGLFQILKPLEQAGTLQLWENYVAAFRANRLLAEGKERNFGRTWDAATQDWVRDPITGDPTWDATLARTQIDERLALATSHPEFEAVRLEYADFQKSLLDLAEKAGLLEPTKFDAAGTIIGGRGMWENMDYVPFYRIAEEVSETKGPKRKTGFADQRSGIRKLKGGAASVAILENIVRNAESLLNASVNNHAMQLIADLADSGTDLMAKIPYKAIPFKASVGEIVATLDKAGIDTTSLSTADMEEFVKFWRMQAPKGKDVVSVMVKGRPIYYRVKDAPLLRSIRHMGARQHAAWMKMLMAPKSALTNLVTLDPAFMAANTIRDAFSAWVMADSPIKPGYDSAIGFVKSLRDDPSKIAMMAAGGGSGHYNALIQDKEVRRYLNRLTPSARKAFKDSIIDTVGKAARIWGEVGRASENANRIPIYDSAIRGGATEAEGAFQSRDIMDFALRGDSALLGFFLDTVPFLNARIQSLYKMGRASGIGHGTGVTQYLPHGKHAVHGAVITGATLLLLAKNWDDDRYWELPEWERDIYYHFWLGDQHIRIPKPFEVGQIFSTIPERMFEFMAKTGDGELLAKRMLTMVGDTFAMNPIPQAMKPLAERAMNLNTFTGRPIVSRGDEYKAPEQQFNVLTSDALKEVAQAMPDSAPEWMRSPKTLEHFVRGYFGSLGMYSLAAADAMTRAATGAPEEPAVAPGDWWVMKRFAPSSDLKESKFVGQFYDLHREITGMVRQIKELQKTDPAAARDLRNENADLLRYAPRAESTYDFMQSLRKQEQQVYENKAMDPDEKRRRLAAIAARRNQASRSTMDSAPRRPSPIYNPFK
jgi:hypothetical protein